MTPTPTTRTGQIPRFREASIIEAEPHSGVAVRCHGRCDLGGHCKARVPVPQCVPR